MGFSSPACSLIAGRQIQRVAPPPFINHAADFASLCGRASCSSDRGTTSPEAVGPSFGTRRGQRAVVQPPCSPGRAQGIEGSH